MGPVGHAATDDVIAADANDVTAATNAAGDATYDGAHAAGKHDGTTATLWRAKPVRKVI